MSQFIAVGLVTLLTVGVRVEEHCDRKYRGRRALACLRNQDGVKVHYPKNKSTKEGSWAAV